MHIAICDDNIADRKHLERLLSRESDRRLSTTGVFYIDSYGHDTSLLRAPMVYDLFFIDMALSDQDGMETARKLRECGVTAPIVLCCGRISYQTLPCPPTDLLFVEKPIQPEILTPLLTGVIAHHSERRPTIEIRDEENTYYILPEDILWASEESHIVTIHLLDGTCRRMLGSIMDFCTSLENYPQFWLTRKKCVVNIDYITKTAGGELTVNHTAAIPLAFGESYQIRKILSTRLR